MSKRDGFEPNDIPKLIDLAKETGKIKFALETNPLQYQELDYLQPIFDECKPPVLFSIPHSNFIDERISKQHSFEFIELSKMRYYEQLKYNIMRTGGNEDFFKRIFEGREQVYSALKILGFDNAINEISKGLIDNPKRADHLLSAYMLITNPIFDALTANYNYSLTKIEKFGMENLSNNPNIKIPEIGKLIMKKLVPNPTSYYGCIDVIQKYRDNDLYKLLDAFNDAVKKNQGDSIIQKKSELETIADNVWLDAQKLGSHIREVKTGLSFAFGVGGIYGVTALQSEPVVGPMAALTGLFAGLGFNTIESHFDEKKTALSEKIMKFLKPSYLVSIYDFKKKYKID